MYGLEKLPRTAVLLDRKMLELDELASAKAENITLPGFCGAVLVELGRVESVNMDRGDDVLVRPGESEDTWANRLA